MFSVHSIKLRMHNKLFDMSKGKNNNNNTKLLKADCKNAD